MGSVPNLILEIGTEEIPSGYIEAALGNLRASSKRIFEENFLEYNSLETFTTPRRLVLFVKDLSRKQLVKKQTKRGPSLEICYDANGKPTEKLTGFMRRFNLKQADLTITEENGKKYICGSITEKPKPAKEILKNILPDLILRIDFPKSMIWDSFLIRFARPIRWILALHGNMVIPFDIGSLRSNNLTYGHRFLMPGPFKVKDAMDYFKVLKNSFVILDSEKRKERILKEIDKKIKGVNVENAQLLDSIKYLVEYPSVFVGDFDKDYAGLPKEIIVHTMTKNQRILAISDKNGKLMPRFIAVANGKPKKLDAVKRHYEGILNAKLKDATFFLKEDFKIKLIDRIKLLKNIIFHKEVGTFFDKIERLRILSGFVATELNIDAKLKEKLNTAVLLSKVDLTTSMVREFPDLQGIVGSAYASKEGYENQISQTIYEHYLPRQAGDVLPESAMGKVLALADKFDNLMSHLAIGIQPTGSEDPYGLRRNANGFILIWFNLDTEFRLSLDKLLNESIKSLDKKISFDKVLLNQRLKDFLKERFYTIFLDVKKDLLDAILIKDFDNLSDVRKRILDLSNLKKDLEEARVIIERTSNILRQGNVSLPEIDKTFFKEDEESNLYNLLLNFKKEAHNFLKARQYDKFTTAYSSIFLRPINTFFDKVRVNVDDQKIRLNRMALLKEINMLYTDKVADLSRLVRSNSHKQSSDSN